MMESKLTEKQQTEVEIKTVDTLLDRGVQVRLPAPRLLRWLGKRTLSLTVKRPSSETMYRICGLYLRMKGEVDSLDASTLDEAHRLVCQCMRPATRIVAYGIAPYATPWGLRNRLLARYLRRHLDTRALAELWAIVAGMSGVHDFSNFIRSMSGMRITMPRTTD